MGFNKNNRGQSGQALFEYIALLFIGTLMVLGLVYQFNDAFKKYLDAWFNGDESGYLFCLIQNGYLPGESDTCPLPQFNLKSGQSKSSFGGSNIASGNQAANGGGGAAGTSQNSTGGSFSGDKSGGGRKLIPVGPNFGGKGKNIAGGAGGGKSGEDTGSTGFSSGAISGGGTNGLNTKGQSRGRYVPLTGSDDVGEASVAQKIPATERDLKPQDRFVAAEKARKKEADDEASKSKFTFGKILKFLVIIFILFSIFFFIGSQLLAISQGGKKRGR